MDAEIDYQEDVGLAADLRGSPGLGPIAGIACWRAKSKALEHA